MPHHELKQLPDGKIEVKLETGETFTGDPLEVTAKLADSKVETRRHYEAKEAELLAKQTPAVAEPEPAQPQTQEAQWQAYILEQTAKGLGYNSAAEYKADLMAVKQKTAEFENHAIAATFMGQHPEFPNTEEANKAVTELIQKNGLPFTPETLGMAHAKLVQDGAYKALTQEEINASWSGRLQASNRPTPPPMPSGGNPESGTPPLDLWTEPLDQQRKRILAAQRAELRGGQ